MKLTWSLLIRLASVFPFPLCLAAFQNCFWAEYLFMGHIFIRQSLNFFGGFWRSPASGQTTVRSSTKLERKIHLKLQTKTDIRHRPKSNKKKKAYPKVLRNPLTLPSANRDITSPKWRNIVDPILSPILYN